MAKSLSLPTALLLGLCSVESNLNPGAVHFDDGGANSHGLCQIKLKTAQQYDEDLDVRDLYDPVINATMAGYHLKSLLKRYKGDVRCAVAAYNAGSCKKNEKGQIYNRTYVRKVMNEYARYQQE